MAARALLFVALTGALWLFVPLPAHADKGCADVNKNGSVDSVDASIILQVDAGPYVDE